MPHQRERLSDALSTLTELPHLLETAEAEADHHRRRVQELEALSSRGSETLRGAEFRAVAAERAYEAEASARVQALARLELMAQTRDAALTRLGEAERRIEPERNRLHREVARLTLEVVELRALREDAEAVMASLQAELRATRLAERSAREELTQRLAEGISDQEAGPDHGALAPEQGDVVGEPEEPEAGAEGETEADAATGPAEPQPDPPPRGGRPSRRSTAQPAAISNPWRSLTLPDAGPELALPGPDRQVPFSAPGRASPPRSRDPDRTQRRPRSGVTNPPGALLTSSFPQRNPAGRVLVLAGTLILLLIMIVAVLVIAGALKL